MKASVTLRACRPTVRSLGFMRQARHGLRNPPGYWAFSLSRISFRDSGRLGSSAADRFCKVSEGSDGETLRLILDGRCANTQRGTKRGRVQQRRGAALYARDDRGGAGTVDGGNGRGGQA